MKTNSLFNFALLLAIFSVIDCLNYKELLAQEWGTYKDSYSKRYESSEDEYRFHVFLENKHLISRHNQKAARGERSYTLSLNEFADILPHEFVQIMNGYKYHMKKQLNESGSLFLTPSFLKVPDAVDWRKHDLVTPVKNQGQCGSCWAFSSTGSLEGQHARKTKRLVSLSEQNLVDCSETFGNKGCGGGLMDNAFKYVKSNGGIDTETSYPYEAQNDRCRFKKSAVGATDSGYVDVPSGSEKKLQEAVAAVGPISVAIDASDSTFQFYSGGVYDSTECSPEDLDHGVLVVGYGTENGKDYWIVKNSWGNQWGEGGYIRMSRNKNNQCGIATAASYPLV